MFIRGIPKNYLLLIAHKMHLPSKEGGEDEQLVSRWGCRSAPWYQSAQAYIVILYLRGKREGLSTLLKS